MIDVEFEPLAGSPTALADRAAGATRTAERLDDARSRVVRIHHVLEGQRSHAVTAARHTLRDVADRLSLCSGVMRTAAATMLGHASTLASEQDAARLAIVRRADALRRAQARQAEAASVRFDVLAGHLAGPAAAAQRHAAESAADLAWEDVRLAESDWRRARDGKRTASARAATSLEALADPRAARLLVRSGADVQAFQQAWARGLAAAALLDGPIAEGDPLTGSDRDRVRRALRAAGDDPAFWYAFWGATTPRELYAAFGVDPVDDDLIGAMRTGLEQWARSATVDELGTFGEALVEGMEGSAGTELGTRAALAAALLAPTLPGHVHHGAADALADRWAARRANPTELLWTQPVASAAVAGLARHPQAAFDHLAPADEELLARRAHVWFGVAQPTGWSDGGEAVAGALLAAVTAGTSSSGRSHQTRSALLVSYATRELPQGLLAAGTPSDVASARIARAYEPYLPILGDAAMYQKGDTPPPPGTTSDLKLAPGLREKADVVVQPDLDPFALVEVIGATSRTPIAAGEWLAVADRYNDAVVAHAFTDAYDRRDQENIALSGIQDVGSIVGALQSETLALGRSHQLRQDAVVNGAVSLLGTVATKRPLLVDAAGTAAGTTLLHVLPDREAEATDVVLRSEADLRTHYARPAFEAAMAYDVARGIPADFARSDRETLDPSIRIVCGNFGETFNLMTDLGRKLGQNSCKPS